MFVIFLYWAMSEIASHIASEQHSARDIVVFYCNYTIQFVFVVVIVVFVVQISKIYDLNNYRFLWNCSRSYKYKIIYTEMS